MTRVKTIYYNRQKTIKLYLAKKEETKEIFKIFLIKLKTNIVYCKLKKESRFKKILIHYLHLCNKKKEIMIILTI